VRAGSRFLLSFSPFGAPPTPLKRFRLQPSDFCAERRAYPSFGSIRFPAEDSQGSARLSLSLAVVSTLADSLSASRLSC